MNYYSGPFNEETSQGIALFLVKCGKPWKRCSYTSIERWWNSPDTSIAIRSFFNLVKFVFFHPIGWISYNCMYAVFWNSTEPFKTICMQNTRSAYFLGSVVKG